MKNKITETKRKEINNTVQSEASSENYHNYIHTEKTTQMHLWSIKWRILNQFNSRANILHRIKQHIKNNFNRDITKNSRKFVSFKT